MPTPSSAPLERLADPVRQRLVAFTPRTDTHLALWDRLQHPVVDAVARTAPATVAEATLSMSLVTAYAVRLVATGAWNPDDGRPVPFEPTLVEHHVVQVAAEGGAASAGTTRSKLAVIGRANDPDRWPRPTPLYKATPASTPYTTAEQQHLADAARIRLSVTGDVVPLAVVAGGLGAGLRPDDFRRLSGGNIIIDGAHGRTVIADGPRTRERHHPRGGRRSNPQPQAPGPLRQGPRHASPQARTADRLRRR